MPAKLLRKISPATVAEAKLQRLDLPGSPSEVVLYDAYGIAGKTKQGRTDKGDWLAFKGEFEAITPEGEVFRSGTIHLQQPMEDMLLSALMTAQEVQEGSTVQFAVRVSLVPPKKGKPSMTGYEYRITPLVEARDAAPMLSLREQAQAALKQLAAPVADTKQAANGKK